MFNKTHVAKITIDSAKNRLSQQQRQLSILVRLYYGFRGGDRPKNAEAEFPEVCVSPKGAYEPWMLFRKPIGERTVAENPTPYRVRQAHSAKPSPK